MIITCSEHRQERGEWFQHRLYRSIYNTVSLISLTARSNGRLLLWTSPGGWKAGRSKFKIVRKRSHGSSRRYSDALAFSTSCQLPPRMSANDSSSLNKICDKQTRCTNINQGGVTTHSPWVTPALDCVNPTIDISNAHSRQCIIGLL